MPIRWLNGFNLLALILLAIGIIGALSGGKMVFDPGRVTASGKEWIIYLVAGVLMLINGVLPPATVPDSEKAKGSKPASKKQV